ncbi:MAG: hypothetical protein US49_C0006G0059 [candidate division TM6 bacterium GW2011_GWF2_37_49]|nr:MAG: hypothetical protein US49_C0006G0059 [candidate division TM6 bacterium GW2011_GWF2_37_49]
MNTLNNNKNLQPSYKFCYYSFYEEIYDSSYGTCFVFVDEDDEFIEDVDFDFSIFPFAPSGFCKSKNTGLS